MCAKDLSRSKVDVADTGATGDGVGASRRDVVNGIAGTALGTVVSPLALSATITVANAQSSAGRSSPRNFKEVIAGVDETHHVADGYDANVLIRWGDPLFPSSPAFDPNRQTAEAQKMQFGFNNDFLGFIRLRRRYGLLCVHHEYTDPRMMFPGFPAQGGSTTAAQVAVEMAAVGGSIVEVRQSARNGAWSVVRTSRFNRRITASDTAMRIDGPASGHARMRTKADPTGTRSIGTMAGCAGGITPWNTWLMTEENFHLYFSSSKADAPADQARSWKRYGLPGNRAGWSSHVERYDLDKEPNEANRYGWVIEVDPLDPKSTPVKHTALGRLHREGAETTLSKDGRAVVYSGDDQNNEFVYKFVSKGRYSYWNSRRTNRQLLSAGTLYVAKFNADKSGQWLPLIFGQGPLTPANGFASEADVLIDTRLAATALGATPMDRPEDVEPGPNGRVIVACSNNNERKPGDTNPANPRAPNPHGHLIEMVEAGADHAATTFRWSFLVQCGPRDQGGTWHPDTTSNGWLSCPDNVAFDPFGSLWVATDQGGNWTKLTARADGLYAVAYRGERRGRSRLFFRAPVGAEVTGPRFTPEGNTLFLSVQHPSADGTKDWAKFGRVSTASDPATRWPDFKPDMPPRPSVLAITKRNGGPIGS